MTDDLGHYFEQMSRIPRLTRDGEIELAKRIEMAVEIHAHERHELQKSRIDAA